MKLLLGLLVFGGVGAAVYFGAGLLTHIAERISDARRRGVRGALERASARLQLEASEGPRGPQLEGRVGELPLKVSRSEMGFVNLCLGPAPDLPADLGFGRRSGFEGADSILSGDPELDAWVELRGDPLEVMSLLDTRTRSLLTMAVRRGAELERGMLFANEQHPGERSPELERAVTGLAELLERLRRPEDPVATLLALAEEEQDVVVRTRMLVLAAAHVPEALRAKVVGCADHDEITQRFLAALEDEEALLALLSDDYVTAWRQLACEILGERGSPAALAPLRAVRGPLELTVIARRAVARIIERHPLPPGGTLGVLHSTGELGDPGNDDARGALGDSEHA